MRVVLVDNLLFEKRGGREYFDLQPHLGLISLLGALRKAGHDGALFDPKLFVRDKGLRLERGLYRSIAKAILELEPTAIGFTSLGCNFICTAQTAMAIRKMAPGIPILLGGPHATILDLEILNVFPQFDLIIRHEAEEFLAPAIESLSEPDLLRSVPSITYRHAGHIHQNASGQKVENLDSLPWPAFECYPIERLGLKSIRIEAGRGCPFSCTFCSTAEFFGRSYRLKSVARLCAEIDHVQSKYGISDFSLTHDLFTVNKRKVREFCEAIASRAISWTCSARMDCVDRELLAKMAAAGCRAIYYGVETGSKRLQRTIKKRQDLNMFESTLDASQENGIACTVSFITGYPDEIETDQVDTLNMLGACLCRDERLTNPQLHLLTPEPGTPMLVEHAHKLKFDGYISDFNFPLVEADDEVITAANPGIFMNHHFFESHIPRARHIFVSESFNALLQLDRQIVRAVVRAFGNLGCLVTELWAHACSESFKRMEFSWDLLERVIYERVDASVPLGSVVRYLIAVEKLSEDTESIRPTGEKDGVQKFQLRRCAKLLRQIHNPRSILDEMAKGIDVEQIAANVACELADYVVTVQGTPERTITQISADAHVIEACAFFQVPKSRSDFLAAFSDKFTNPKVGFELLRKSVLEKVRAPIA